MINAQCSIDTKKVAICKMLLLLDLKSLNSLRQDPDIILGLKLLKPGQVPFLIAVDQPTLLVTSGVFTMTHSRFPNLEERRTAAEQFSNRLQNPKHALSLTLLFLRSIIALSGNHPMSFA